MTWNEKLEESESDGQVRVNPEIPCIFSTLLSTDWAINILLSLLLILLSNKLGIYMFSYIYFEFWYTPTLSSCLLLLLRNEQKRCHHISILTNMEQIRADIYCKQISCGACGEG